MKKVQIQRLLIINIIVIYVIIMKIYINRKMRKRSINLQLMASNNNVDLIYN